MSEIVGLLHTFLFLLVLLVCCGLLMLVGMILIGAIMKIIDKVEKESEGDK